MMKLTVVLLAILSVATAFAPQSAGRANSQLSESLADRVRKTTVGLCDLVVCNFL
jgi:hypothetical protein